MKNGIYTRSNTLKNNKDYGCFFSAVTLGEFNTGTLGEFNPLNTYSAISIMLSLTFAGIGILLFISKVYILKNLIIQKIVRTKPVFLLCLMGIFFERFTFNLSNIKFTLYLVITNTILLAFLCLRLGIILKNPFVLDLPVWVSCILITFALICSIIRGFIRLGYVIETFPEDNPHILYFWGETTEFIKHSPRRVIKTIMTAPENPGQRNHRINLTTLGLTAVGVTFAGTVWWETRLGNKIGLQNLEVNKRNVDVTEVNGDRQAVKDGFMTRENYDQKWDPFGKRRK